MNWVALSVKEWQRRPLRAGITAAGVAIAVAALFSLMAFHDGYRDGLGRELDRLGAHILVVPKGCPYDAASIALHGANWPCYLKHSYLEEVRATPGVAHAAPALMTAFNNEFGGKDVFVGVDENMLALRPGWHIDGHFPRAKDEILAGSEVARRNQWRVGESVAIHGMPEMKATVAGILQPTQGSEDSFVYLRLTDAQKAFKHDAELTHILVRLSDPNELDHAVTQLRGCNAGMDMNIVPLTHLFRTIQSLVNSTRVLLGCVAMIALLIVGAGVANAVLMSIAERTREIGVMRAIGGSCANIFALIWMETIQLCVVGGTIGIALAFVTSRAVESWLRSRLPFAPTDSLIHWDWSIALLCLSGAVLLGMAAGLLPAWRATRMTPMEAFRQGAGA